MATVKQMQVINNLLGTTGVNRRVAGWKRKPVNDIRFAHATGRLRSLASLRLNEETLLRFSDAATDVATLNNFLDQANYPQADTLEERLALQQQANLALLKQTTSSTDLADILLLANDFHNLKWLLKNLLLMQVGEQQNNTANDLSINSLLANQNGVPASITNNLLPAGKWVIAHLWRDLLKLINNEGAYLALDRELVTSLRQVLKLYQQHQDIGLVTRAIDQLYYQRFNVAALADTHKLASEFLLDYLAIQADAANLQTCLRALEAKLSANALLEALVPGGEVALLDLLQVYTKLLTQVGNDYQQQMDNICKAFSHLYRGKLTERLLTVLPAWTSTKGRWLFTKEYDELLLRLALKGHYNTYGCDAVCGFWLEQELEIKNLRIMLALRPLNKPFAERLELLRKGDYYGTR